MQVDNTSSKDLHERVSDAGTDAEMRRRVLDLL